MTRKEQIEEASFLVPSGCSPRDKIERINFIMGAEWADANPIKSQLISEFAEQINEECLDDLDRLERQNEIMLKALEFYSKCHHFEFNGDDVNGFPPETVSGELENWECGGPEGAEYTIENGGIASEALEQVRKMREERK